MSTIDVRRVLAGAAWLFLVFAPVAEARGQSASAIVGALRDDSGAPSPGATVEVASPAISKVRKSCSRRLTAATRSWTCARANTRSPSSSPASRPCGASRSR